MARWSKIAMCAALAATVPGAAAAQHPQVRNGFWIGFGLGYGSFGIEDCDGCGREGGFAGNFRLGGSLGDRWLLGFESNGWIEEEFDTSILVSSSTATVYFYPVASGGLHLKGGLGLAHLDVEDVGDETGLGVLLGAGYDVRIGRNTSLVPFAGWTFGDFEGGSTNVLHFGIGFTFH